MPTDVPETPPIQQRAQIETKDNTARQGCLHTMSRVAGVGALVIFLACIVLIIILRWRAPSMDFATVNVLTLILGFFGLVALLTSVLLRSDVSLLTRLLTVGTIIVLVCAAMLTLRIARVSGRLVPTLRWRWSVKPDQLLATPQVAQTAGGIDLTTSTPNDFPQFLGPDRNLSLSLPKLDRDWNANPPELMWRRPIGAGWSGLTAVNGYAVTMEQRGPDELVTCYKVETGDLLWVHGTEARHETIMGGVGPRCTPTVDEGLVYALGATGILRCLDGATGELKWSDNLLQRCGVTPEEDLRAVAWGRAASPLVVGQLLIVPLGGPKGGPFFGLAAYDKTTGQLRWQGGADQVSYASPTLATLCGIQQVVIVNEKTVSGHRVEDGQIIWSYPWEGNSAANASTSQAVVLSDERVLLSKDYGTGAELIQLTARDDSTLQADRIWAKSSLLKTKFTNVVVKDEFAYGLSDGILECVELDGTGKRRWKDRRRGSFGHGQILAVDDVILVQDESGDVVMVELNPTELVVLGRLTALSDQTWNNLCLYGPYLLVRNSVEAACFKLPLRN